MPPFSATAPAATGSPTVPAAAVPSPAAPAAAAPVVPATTSATMFAPVAATPADAIITTLANDFLEVRFTDYGGAIRDVAYKKYAAVQGRPEPFVFNEKHAAPILALDTAGLDAHARFTLVSASATEVVYRATLENGLEVTRRYTLAATVKDPATDPAAYRIRHETTFRNPAERPNVPATLTSLGLGTAGRVNAGDLGQYLASVRHDGEKAVFTSQGDFSGGAFLAFFGLGTRWEKSTLDQPGAAVWTAIDNQFFTSIYTPDQPGLGLVSRRVQLGTDAQPEIGLTGAASFTVPALAPGASAQLAGDLYVGPKEYNRLSELKHREDKVMQFDRSPYSRIFLSGYVAPFQNWLMNQMHRVVGNWGLAIVLMTLLLKFISLPFTLIASRSAKRMQKLQPLMAAVREKHKDNPQKLNQATMALFKEHKINPLGGCLPILITMPLFIGFFTMLGGTAELRFQGFLWATDLSGPDTVAHLLGVPLNIMPLLMGATMFYQMKLTPSSPTMDSTQATMMKIMPFMFTAICYNFSCALALYSTVNGAFTIVQQLLVNKYAKVDDPAPVTGPGGRLVKNVTPKKKG